MTPFVAISVFVGGGIGAVLRYAFGLFAAAQWGAAFPSGTLGVNIIGSFAIGFLAVLLPAEGPGALWRLALITGVLGGFTTFSAFSLETLQLAQRGETGLALAYIASSLIFSLAAVWSGWSLARLF